MEQEDSNFNGIHTIDYCTCVTKAKKKINNIAFNSCSKVEKSKAIAIGFTFKRIITFT